MKGAKDGFGRTEASISDDRENNYARGEGYFINADGDIYLAQQLFYKTQKNSNYTQANGLNYIGQLIEDKRLGEGVGIGLMEYSIKKATNMIRNIVKDTQNLQIVILIS